MSLTTPRAALFDVVVDPPSSGPFGIDASVILAVVGIVAVVIAALLLSRSRRRRGQGSPPDSTHAVALFAVVIVGDAAPSGPILIGFLGFLLAVVAIFIALIVFAVLGIRKWVRSRAARGAHGD